MGMTWGELAKLLGFLPEREEWYSESSGWMQFRQWAGHRWDDYRVDPDAPVGLEKSFQLLLQRMQELNLLTEKKS